jgi:hypothetical protein
MKSDKQYFTTLKCTRRSALYLNEVHSNKLHDIKVNC